MRQQFRVSKLMRTQQTLTAAKAQIGAGRQVILTYGIHKDGRCSRVRVLCSSPGKHPLSKFIPNGVHSAIDDMDLVRKALRRHPDANLAISLAGLTVVDVDGDTGAPPWSILGLAIPPRYSLGAVTTITMKVNV